ncbi:unnamed protein product [Parascedosporium putredinis]|uniref:Urea active transporter n=1 Tax=Parascedosporium putredinis TaxID=1442378 RepID=A0A9P1GXM4_9PEZI|nr:unnamed protein product [Parascedosporium putredinis]CAI7990733.1 unnamed protein product [Parascedosporium putredinis]
MASHGGMLFGIIHILANFGLVIMDTGFFVKAFSARPQAVVPGYVVGGLAYFAIPWCLGTLMSSIALGLEDSPSSPPTPAACAAAILIITFMAVTSTLSAQVIAVSSIISFDIYRQYVNKAATDRDVIKWSHVGVVFFGLFSACFSTILHYGKVDLGWTLYMLGVLTCPGIFPTTFAILWKKQSTAAAVAVPCTWGTAASALSPAVYSIIISLAKPANFDWADFSKEKLTLEDPSTSNSESNDSAVNSADEGLSTYQENKVLLKRWGRIASIWSLATFFGHWVLWPLPMYASKYIFEKGFYVAWLVVAIIWVWGTMFITGFYPIIDGREQIWNVIKLLRNGQQKTIEGRESSVDGEEGVVVEKKS